MLRPNPLSLVAAAVLLLALAGCDFHSTDLSDGLAPVADAVAVPPLGQEIFRMIVAEKPDARKDELCAQF
ncbi:hypothetical protein HHL11_21850 [Ramlibacter sp. G-1-2-2]|uniref:Uncharacterized protein n=1 Tax=Ramlibacter agri TaxID=2728837 RepID=A0A848HFL8_9BURK|nr:hypothetical protein [Ramlibacter agri]NML46408.1 hypothetical protein [Ramlibacter agri]